MFKVNFVAVLDLAFALWESQKDQYIAEIKARVACISVDVTAWQVLCASQEAVALCCLLCAFREAQWWTL